MKFLSDTLKPNQNDTKLGGKIAVVHPVTFWWALKHITSPIPILFGSYIYIRISLFHWNTQIIPMNSLFICVRKFVLGRIISCYLQTKQKSGYFWMINCVLDVSIKYIYKHTQIHTNRTLEKENRIYCIAICFMCT